MTIDLQIPQRRYTQSTLWDGLTERGNLTHRATRHIENAQSELWAVCEVFLARREVTEARHALSIRRRQHGKPPLLDDGGRDVLDARL